MSLHHSPRIVTDNLVLCLDAGNSRSYPGSGTTWTDLISTSNNGTLVNSPVYSLTNSGIFTFNGTSQYADCGLATTIANLINNFSVEIWIKYVGSVAVSGNGQWFIANVSAIGTAGGFELGYVPADGGFVFYTFGNLVGLSANVTPVVGTWYCVTATKSSTTGYSIYVNAVLKNTNGTLTNGGVATYNLRIAHRERDGGNAGYFPGSVASVKVYNKVMTGVEVAQNFNALRGRFGL